MLYHVSRNGQTYGPYSLEDLQRYLASGNVLPTDLARSESMSEWLPVAQILGGAPAASAQPPVAFPPGYGAYPVAPAGAYPNPPNLHWALLLLIGIFFSFFLMIWDLVEAVWMRKIAPQSKALYYYIAAFVLAFGSGFVVVLSAASMAWRQQYAGFGVAPPSFGAGFVLVIFALGIATLVLVELARFDMRRFIQQHYNTAEPIGLALGPIMTFFFGGLYFQYHFTRINEMKRQALYAGVPVR